MSASQIQNLFLDPDLPWALYVASGGKRAVYVDELLDFAKTRLGETPDLDASLDDFVAAHGGERLEQVYPLNPLRRLLSRRPKRPRAVYELPADFLEQSPAGFGEQVRAASRARRPRP